MFRDGLLGVAVTTLGALALLRGSGAPSWPAAQAVLVWPILALSAGPSLREHPHPVLGLANQLTLFRAVWVGCLAAFVGRAELAPPFLLAAMAGGAFFLDGVDGRIARRRGTASKFGARLDMELDAITVVVLCALVWDLGHAGAWVGIAGALRYLFVGASWVWPWMQRPLFETPRRAWVCGAQITTLIVCLAPWPNPALPSGIAAAGVMALVLSFAVDTGWLFANRGAP